MDRLTEYDYIIEHRPCKANTMGLADGMSRMQGRYSQIAIAGDIERMAMVLTHPRPKTVLPVAKKHGKYRECRWYGKVVNFLLDGPEALKGLGKNEIRNVKRMSFRYRLTDQHLLYAESSGEMAKCLLPFEVRRMGACGRSNCPFGISPIC